jgi:sterol desaturase/sphingolipid hydroxylase (fatty acid hydroxylase superfamily)
MTATTAALITVGILLFSNFIGFLYSMLVLHTKTFVPYRIQKKSYQERIFSKRMGLFLFNFATLLALSGFGIYFAYDTLTIDTTWNTWWVVAIQVIVAFVIDDFWFYFMHKWLHTNKFMLKHVHSIHHRATTPFPLEYLYAHPAEWMLGMVGTIAAFGLIMLVMPLNIYAFWIFGLVRNLHEIHIHSDLELPIISKLPFISKTRHHDDHHARLNGNYSSTFVWMDKLFNTELKNN